MKLQNRLAARRLVQAVDVLGDDGAEFSRLFQLGQLFVRGIGFCICKKHFVTVKPIKFSGVSAVEGMTQDGFGGIIILLMIQTVHTPEIRDAALGGDACAAEKNNVVIPLHNLA